MDYVIAISFVLLALVVGALPVFFRKRLVGDQTDSDTKDAASATGFRIAGLHALILALVFADGQSVFSEQQENVQKEAAKITEIAYGLRRYGSPAADNIEPLVEDFLRIAMTQEWQNLGRHGRLSDAAWGSYQDVVTQVLALEPNGIRQETLYRLLVDSLQEVADSRQERLFQAGSSQPVPFWVIAFAGFLLIVSLFGVFPTSRSTIGMIGGYSLMMGMVLFVIYEYSHPYSGLMQISARPFESAYEEIRADIGSGVQSRQSGGASP